MNGGGVLLPFLPRRVWRGQIRHGVTSAIDHKSSLLNPHGMAWHPGS